MEGIKMKFFFLITFLFSCQSLTKLDYSGGYIVFEHRKEAGLFSDMTYILSFLENYEKKRIAGGEVDFRGPPYGRASASKLTIS
jgi:hypothetical protein